MEEKLTKLFMIILKYNETHENYIEIQLTRLNIKGNVIEIALRSKKHDFIDEFEATIENKLIRLDDIIKKLEKLEGE